MYMIHMIHLGHCTSVKGKVGLPSSKSESNRLLIMKALASSDIHIQNLSTARDTFLLNRALNSDARELNIMDAGTTMRFLTAYFTVKGENRILTGTKRMKERPIKLLVDALESIGGKISYLQKEGYPPIEIHAFEQKTKVLEIEGNISSQYISALLMVAPALEQGLEMRLIPPVTSLPYIKMTLSLMGLLGISYDWKGNNIKIANQNYRSGTYTVESDWSAASYWYSMVSLAQKSDVFLKGLRKNSIQGDSAIVEIMEHLGVKTEFEQDGVRLIQAEAKGDFEYDFTSCPDLAQTIAVLCACKGIKAHLTGLHTLKIKESDRIEATKTELAKLGAEVETTNESMHILSSVRNMDKSVCVDTYHDHRMAMAFAPVCLLRPLDLDDETVVVKSYPHFWEDVKDYVRGLM